MIGNFLEIKKISLLFGQRSRYRKYPGFLSEWYSRAQQLHYIKSEKLGFVGKIIHHQLINSVKFSHTERAVRLLKTFYTD